MNRSKELKLTYKEILSTIEVFQKKHQQTEDDIKLLAVSKNQPIEKILELIQFGHQDFAENYVNEAINKIYALKSFIQNCPSINWHYIGQIQSNKTQEIAQNFSWVHSVDRLKIAQRLSDQRPANLGKLNILIQVNLQNDTFKGGVSPEAAIELAKEICFIKNSNVLLRGFMCILKLEDNSSFNQQFDDFKRLFNLRSELNKNNNFNLDTLSMGMSNDYEAAIAAGSNMVRIGTMLFGKRGIK